MLEAHGRGSRKRLMYGPTSTLTAVLLAYKKAHYSSSWTSCNPRSTIPIARPYFVLVTYMVT